MDDDAPHTMRWPRVVGYACLAVVLYVLSVGPVAYVFARRSSNLDEALGRFYEPLIWMGDTNDLVEAYVDWWYALPAGPDERLLRQSTPLPAVNDLAL